MTNDIRGLADGVAEPRRQGFARWIAGRGRRREFWLWLIPLMILEFVLAAVGAPVAAQLCGLPMLLIMIRRLHDLGHSGWFAPVINITVTVLGFAAKGFLPPVAANWASVLIFVAAVTTLGGLPGEPKRNEFGPQPGGARTANLKDTFG
ncbi:MAG: DUF805 domain-containing protein [Phenylobacterium sp.]